MKRLIIAVSNDLVHDRRMQRSAGTLARAGYSVTLVGRQYPDSPPLSAQPFDQQRLHFWFRKGKLFYLELQCRLFFYLLRVPAEGLVAVDIDTLLPVVWASRLRGIPGFLDAHEDFTEVPELIGRSLVRSIWGAVARWGIPRVQACYTVGPALAAILTARYGRPFEVVRNVPPAQPEPDPLPGPERRMLWYHGALNAGRGLETLLEALTALPEYQACIAGEGDLSAVIRKQAEARGVAGQITFLGWVAPDDLWRHMQKASLAVNLLDARSASYYYSLANKTFDYVQAMLPAIHMDFPEYRALFADNDAAVLVRDLDPQQLVRAVRSLEEPERYARAREALRQLRHDLVWEREEGRLLAVFNPWMDGAEQEPPL